MSEIDVVRARIAAHPRPPEPVERRARMDAMAATQPLDPDIRLEPVDAGGVPGEWSLAPDSDPGRVLLFLHGGGYMSGSIVSHRGMVVAAGRAAGMRTLAIDYRRAPEHPFPAALDDALAAYRFLLSSGIAPEKIALGGDSAGGGLSLALMVRLRDAGEPLPAGAWLVSPWTDLTLTAASIAGKAAVDPILDRPYLEGLVAAYLAGGDPRNPLASPLFADLAGLPPLLVQVGSAETLLDDAVGVVARAGAAGVPVRLEIWPEMIHVWHLWQAELADARRATATAGAFLCDLGRAPSSA